MEINIDKKCTWVIAYINRDFIYRVEQDIDNFCRAMGDKIFQPQKMKAYIPTVKILRKQFKGREIFEEIPLLFNYGFFQIPNKNLDVDLLIKMKENILCIHQWVKDGKTVMKHKPGLIEDKEVKGRKDIIDYACASDSELKELIQSHKKYSLYDKYDIDNLQAGTIITLKGYPFDDIPAKIISVDKDKEKVKVELLVEGIIKKTVVAFDNILYSVYHGNMNENEFKEKYLEEQSFKKRNQNAFQDYDENPI